MKNKLHLRITRDNKTVLSVGDSEEEDTSLSLTLNTSNFSAFKSAESIILSHSGRITDIDESSITAEFPSSDEMHKAQSQLSERK